MYYRFVTSRRDRDSLRPEGIFCSAFRWLDDLCAQGDASTVWLTGSIEWFQDNLYSPGAVPDEAIFWFDCWSGWWHREAWSLVYALRELGETVFMWRTEAPGEIVYEDADQVAAIPYRDTRWRVDAI